MKNFIKEINNRGYKTIYFSSNDSKSWNALFYDTIDISFYFSYNQIGYELEKFKVNKEDCEAVFFYNPKGSFALKYYKKSDQIFIFPLRFQTNFNLIEGNAILKLYVKHLNRLEEDIIYHKLPFSNSIENIFKANFFRGNKLVQFIEMYIDLNLSKEDLWKSIRSSYKSIINKDKVNRSVTQVTDEYEWKACQELHFKVSGRRTRSNQTWKIQWKMIKDKSSVAFCVKDKGQIAGFSLFYLSKNIVTYAVGAYDRNLFKERPVSHILLWRAIEFFKSLEIDYLFLGEEYLNMDLRDQKLADINHFKKGFANYYLNDCTIEYKSSK